MNRYFTYLFIFINIFFNFSKPSSAEVGILLNCHDSSAFTKRLNSSVKKLETRLAKYEKNTPPAFALQHQIDQTKSRFSSYSESNLLCGSDGLPHLIVDGDFQHASEFVIPGFLFLYIAGWIGWAGRNYIRVISLTKNPTEKEIIIDVPLALSIMFSAYFWPISAWMEFSTGNFVAKSDDITVSPR
jgi:photosystem I subunit 3